MHRAIFTAAVTLLLAGPAFADVSLSVANAHAEGGKVQFDLLVLNDDATRGDEFAAPAELGVRVVTAYNNFDAVAHRVDDTPGDATIIVRAGGFMRVPYVIDRETTGELTVAIRQTQPKRSSTQPTTMSAESLAESRPASNPIDAIMRPDANYRSELGLVEYLANRIKPHEPVYIIAGNEEPSTKFQFSFKYQVLNPDGPIAKAVPPLAGVYFAYSQTSLWDLGADSSPFYDSVYRPEALLSYDNLDRFFVNSHGDRWLPDWIELAAQAGFRHESNGRDGLESRSLNYIYARPILTFRGNDDWFITVAPTFFSYVADLSDNPEIEDYRGHTELRVVAGQGGGVQLAAIGRMGDTGTQQGSIQLDLSVPIRKLTLGNFDIYFHTQYFAGYGESLITYNEPTYALRFGISLVR